MPHADDLLNRRLSLAQACRALGIDPCLRPGESVTWMHLDPTTGTASTPVYTATIRFGTTSRMCPESGCL